MTWPNCLKVLHNITVILTIITKSVILDHEAVKRLRSQDV
jgi:hypothetical protein